jgi:hypothetical protein
MTLQSRSLKPSLIALGTALALAAAAPAAAQELYTFTVSGFGGFGGSVDADVGDGLDGTGFQLGASMLTEARTRVALRGGQLGLADGDQFESLLDADLSYVTLAGEYRFTESYYAPWAYIGLGGYRIAGDDVFGGGDSDDTALGLVIGLTGDFTITRRLDFVVEISGHYADFDDASVFAMGHAGLAFHF